MFILVLATPISTSGECREPHDYVIHYWKPLRAVSDVEGDYLALLNFGSESVHSCLQKRCDALPFVVHLGRNSFPSQEQCLSHCADKFLKHSERVGARFAELNAGASCSLRFDIWATSYALPIAEQMGATDK